MAERALKVCVVGAGVIGLSTAVLFAEQGCSVEVLALKGPHLTTSHAAGAMWNLSLIEQDEHVVEWSMATLRELTTLAREGRPGVRLVPGVEVCRWELPSPVWARVLDMRLCRPDELPPNFVYGRRFTCPLLDMPVYLDYLHGRLLMAGGSLRLVRVTSLYDQLNGMDVLVNCAGVGAGELAGDPRVYPVYGQVVVTANPGLTDFFAEETGDAADMLYVLPHGDRVVLGGTAVPGTWLTEPPANPQVALAIRERCAEIIPSLAGARVLEHRVGLRPMRHCVRLEVEEQPAGGLLVHCYGHGGSGVSLSWGCAQAVSTAVFDRLGVPGVGRAELL
jgi:D-amino-acid oxidase